MIADPVTSVRSLSGRAPAGMWWVAWRQHRFMVTVCLGVVAALAVAMLVFRLLYDGALRSAGFDYDTCNAVVSGDWTSCEAGWASVNGFYTIWALLRLPLLGLPMAFGALAGASVVALERERGTQVFALTQSVGRTRWYWTKCAVVVAPLVLAMLAVGLLAQWVVAAPGLAPWSPMAEPDFQSLGIVPAVFTLLAFGIAVPIGVVMRSVAAAMGLGLAVVAVVVVTLGYGYYADLVPHDRITYPAADRAAFEAIPDGAYPLVDGFLDVTGAPRAGVGLSCSVGGDTDEELQESWEACLDAAGIVSRYTEYIDPSRRTQLTVSLSGICIGLASAGLALGWFRVRRRIL